MSQIITDDEVDIGLDSAFVPSTKKPLPETM